jgi:hypothetical protein
MDLQNYPFLQKNLSDFEEGHPLLINFELNPKYMDYIDNLLKEIDGTPNLVTKIEEMKDVANWESTLSELEIARKIKDVHPEFIEKAKGSRTPDLKARIYGKDIFFEVKLLLENDETRRIYEEIWKLESDLMIKISHDALDTNQVNRLIDFVADKVKIASTGSFSFEGTDISIMKRANPKSKRTALITLHRGVRVPMEPIRKKVFMEFYDKLIQFESYKPIFWVIDCQRWKYDVDDFKRIFYGKIIFDRTVGQRLFGFSEIIEKAAEDSELFNDTNLVPTLTYPMKDGLFFLKESECLNGVIAKTHGYAHLLINPFAKQQLENESIMQLRKIVETSV